MVVAAPLLQLWMNTMCIRTTTLIKNGSKKCKLKNLCNVKSPILNPPHTNVASGRCGTIDRLFVITMAA